MFEGDGDSTCISFWGMVHPNENLMAKPTPFGKTPYPHGMSHPMALDVPDPHLTQQRAGDSEQGSVTGLTSALRQAVSPHLRESGS